MNILITGANGNLGSTISASKKYNYIKAGRKESQDLGLIKERPIDCIVHCAYDLKNSYSERPQTVTDSNVTSTTRYLELAKELNVKKFIFISTCAVYGASSDTNENIPPTPKSINGLVKLLNERIISEFCESNKIKYHNLRVFNLYGGNDQFSVVGHLLRAARQGKTFNLNNQGESQRDFIHVQDVANIIEEFIARDIEAKTVNIGTGKAIKIKELFEYVKEIKEDLTPTYTSYEEVAYSRSNSDIFSTCFQYDFIDIFKYLDRELNQS